MPIISSFRPLLFRPFEGEIEAFEDVDGTLTASIAISESPDGNRLATLDCSLAPISTANNVWEFSFAISCTALDESELPFSTQDREVAAGYIPSICRPLVVPSVRIIAQRLVGFQEPWQIYRVEKAINPPTAAHRKHDLITDSLRDIGYRLIDSGTDPFGRKYRVMQRGTEEVSNDQGAENDDPSGRLE